MPSRPRTTSRPPTPTEYSSSTLSSHLTGPSLRSHFFNILPKHALFKVKLQIHQISNVPLLSGDFAVKWRFRNVQSPAGNHGGLLSKMKANSSTTTMTLKGKTKDFLDSGDPSLAQSAYPPNGVAGRGSSDDDHSPDYPSPVGTKSSSSSFLVASTGGTPSLTPSPSGAHSEGRGTTDWTELSDHTATWDHSVTLVVRMDVDRESLDLHASELKLIVHQVSCQYAPVIRCKNLRQFVENRSG
jgi:hypothetical protein